MSADKRRERHAHFADGDYLEREENSEKAHEEDALEFKKKQRRRSSVAKLPLGFASLRRVSTTSGDCQYIGLASFFLSLSLSHSHSPFLARDVIYTSRDYAMMPVRLSVCRDGSALAHYR